jgi:hypothetical protein
MGKKYLPLLLALALVGCGSDAKNGGAAGDGDGDGHGDGDGDGVQDAGLDEPAPDAGEPLGSSGATVDTRGATLDLDDGASVSIPAGAVSSPVEVEIAETAAPVAAPEGAASVQAVYRLTPHGTSFDVPVTVRLPASGDAETVALLWLADDQDTSWEAVEGATFADGFVIFESTHFSYYGVFPCMAGSPLCMPPAQHQPCDEHADCPNQDCFSGYCGSIPCTTDGQCPDGLWCVSGACETKLPCSQPTDCEGLAGCIEAGCNVCQSGGCVPCAGDGQGHVFCQDH